MSAQGVHLSQYMLDPPVPYLSDPFQGVHEAPEYITAGWNTDEHLILMDWVGEGGYKAVPDFVEEMRRFGMSRRIPTTFDFASIQGRQVWLALIHAKAAPDVGVLAHVNPWAYEWCYYEVGETNDPRVLNHFPTCLYHDWPLAFRIHGVDPRERQTIEMPWGSYNPLHMITEATIPGDIDLATLATVFDRPMYPYPAFFAVLPLTHIEAVRYVEEDVAAEVEKGGLDLYVVEE
jgi:hypothetical protein